MSPNLEIKSIAERYLDSSRTLTTVSTLGGGVSNLNYKLQTVGPNRSDHKDYVITIYPEQLDWWKIEKERFLRDLTANDNAVLFPQIIDYGTDTQNNTKFAFLLREFVEGGDLDNVLNEVHQNNEGWKVFCHDLGFKLGCIHTHKTGKPGIILMPDQVKNSNWQEFMSEQIVNEYRTLHECAQNKEMAGVTTQDIILTEASLLPKLNMDILTSKSNFLVHGDLRFANIIAGANENVIKIKSFIDLEWSISGDPELDIAFIENWLYFSKYQNEFIKHKGSFLKGYGLKRKLSNNYDGKRTIYHTYRSLNYLKNVFLNQDSDFVQKDPRYAGYIQKHFGILKGISQGKSLEEIGIKSLL